MCSVMERGGKGGRYLTYIYYVFLPKGIKPRLSQGEWNMSFALGRRFEFLCMVLIKRV